MTDVQAAGHGLTQMVEFYELEQQLYQLLLQVTEVQLDALKARASGAEFIFLAEKKDKLLRGIERVERRVLPLKSRYLDNAGRCDQQDRERLDQTLDQILELMDRIAANERTSRTLLERWDADVPRRGQRRTETMPGFSKAAARIRSQVNDPAC